MFGYTIPEKLLNEINDFEKTVEKKVKGEIDSIQFRAKRVAFGIYEQRESETYMIRVRCPAGIITPTQMKVLALISKKYGSGRIHITTRQEVQIHSISDISKIPEILKELYNAKLSTRGGGGNTIRNIVAPADSGISNEEIFDVSPYAILLTNIMIRDDNSWNLPRKFKINFSSKVDNGFARIADVGFIAKENNGEKGFEVWIAGGMGVKPATGKKLCDFIKVEEAGYVAEAVKKLFYHHGNRKNRHQARLRFLWDKIGEKEFRELFDKYYIEVKNDENYKLDTLRVENFCQNENIKTIKLKDDDKVEFEKWKQRFVFSQKQKDLYSVKIPLLLGDIDSNLFEKLAEFLIPYGENVIRFTTMQNILVRNIHEKYLTQFFYFWQENFSNIPYFADKITVCAGADTCKLGLCLSRELAKILLSRFEVLKDNLPYEKMPLIRISGCPNSCGQHWLGELGFYGFAARKDDRLYPAYYVLGNFENASDNFKLAEKFGEISARDLPDFVERVLSIYGEGNYFTFKDFLIKESNNITDILFKYKVPSFREDKNYYFDWGSEEVFSLVTRSSGECSAGFFDFIERDLEKIEDLLKKVQLSEKLEELANNLKQLTYYSSRALLITRGIEAEKEADVYKAFKENFIDTGYIEKSFADLLEIVENGEEKFIVDNKKEIINLAIKVKKLYDSMDTNFQFNTEKKQVVSEEINSEIEKKEENKSKYKIKRFKDLRGVACPMNFVKTKLELSFLNTGDLLEIYLDEGEPIQNVPGSLKGEGHKIVSIEKKENYYSVIVQKG